jgi:ADP-heptose:LPS heptosyltransferase
LSESTSCSARAQAALDRIRRADLPPSQETLALGEECPGDFFRTVVESLADSFDPAQSAAYDFLMSAWGLQRAAPPAALPGDIDTVFVLSRVTLGADIKIVSPILDAMKRHFPAARIVFVAGRKSIELFEADSRLHFIEASYPRTGPVSARIAFGRELREKLSSPRAIVVDPDSRMTQLGLVAPCDLHRHFHFSSREQGSPHDNLSAITAAWLERTFGITGEPYLAPKPAAAPTDNPCAAISLGVGENESKRIPGDFEASLIRLLGARFSSLFIDRGAGGPEARRVTLAVENSGVAHRVRFHEGSFAAFASLISQCDYYAGYDSAGQHAAAAGAVPLVSIFAGAPSPLFRSRWAPTGLAPCLVIDAATLNPHQILELIAANLAAKKLPAYTPLPFGTKEE